MKPFEGLRVLEFGRFIAVPFCGQLLAEGGADVIKVEALDGDQSRHNGPITPTEGRQFINKNRGKRSLCVSLAEPAIQASVRQLAGRSDIVLANFRPGLATRLGLNYDSVAAANPHVIYAENTAYGTTGPMSAMPGMDIVMQAYTGLIHMSGGEPEQLANPMIDYAAAMLMAWGVSTALYHRERTGRGQRLDVSLLQAAMVLQNNQLTHIDAIDGWRYEFTDYLKDAFASGKTWAEVLHHREELEPYRIARAYYGLFPTADGTVAIACNGRSLRLGMLEILGLEDRWTTEPGWLPDDAQAYTDALCRQVTTRLRGATSEHWIGLFRAKGLPIGPVHHVDQLFDDQQVTANGFLGTFEHDLVGACTVVGPPVGFGDSPRHVLPSPGLGEHTREVLHEAGLDDLQIDGLVQRGLAREPSS